MALNKDKDFVNSYYYVERNHPTEGCEIKRALNSMNWTEHISVTPPTPIESPIQITI